MLKTMRALGNELKKQDSHLIDKQSSLLSSHIDHLLLHTSGIDESISPSPKEGAINVVLD